MAKECPARNEHPRRAGRHGSDCLCVQSFVLGGNVDFVVMEEMAKVEKWKVPMDHAGLTLIERLAFPLISFPTRTVQQDTDIIQNFFITILLWIYV